MKSFKSFLNEQQKKGHHSFYHPIKGLYKMTHHPEDGVYHLHNKFGDLTHTFSGHMTPQEIGHELKKHHCMFLVDKVNEELVVELAKTDALHAAANRASASVNIHRGGYNEGMIAKHLNGGHYIDDEHKKMTEHHKKKLVEHDKKYGTNEVRKQDHRAKEQSHVFVQHAKERGYHGVHQVHLTAKPGDIERKTGIKASQQQNPSDIVVKFKRKPKLVQHAYLGLSAKSSSAKAIGFHNGGTKELGNFLTKHLG